jgi:hypothetical protein
MAGQPYPGRHVPFCPGPLSTGRGHIGAYPADHQFPDARMREKETAHRIVGERTQIHPE